MFMFFHVPTQACCEKKFEESFYRARMPVLLAKETGHNSRNEKVLSSKIKLSLPFMVPDLMYKFQMTIGVVVVVII